MKPIIYGSENYWDEHLKKREFEDYTHWIAHYPKDDSLKNNKKAVVRPKRQAWTFWQMTEKAFAGGVNIDIDKFNGSYKEFKLKYE
jgi:GH25 family lysozyme M1 (1,4-beta-N-acetylmuramidase)